MEIAFIARWGRPNPEMYEQAYKLFADMFTLSEEFKRQGKITSFDAYGLETGDREMETGFVIVKGPEAGVNDVLHDPRLINLMTKAAYINSHFSTDMLCTGETLMERVERGRKVVKELEPQPVG